jgi:hypothetical protein
MMIGALVLALLAAPSSRAGERKLRVLTQNLHGYHAMGEERRYAQDRAGRVVAPTSST